MTIEYELTMEDLLEYNTYHLAHSPMAKRTYRKSLYTFPTIWLLLYLLILYGATRDDGDWLKGFIALLPLFSGVPAYLLIYPWYYRRCVRKSITGMYKEGQNRALLTHHRLAISENGIESSSTEGQGNMKWSAVERIVCTHEHALIYVGATEALIVPRRAFVADQDFESFVRTAAKYRDMALA